MAESAGIAGAVLALSVGRRLAVGLAAPPNSVDMAFAGCLLVLAAVYRPAGGAGFLGPAPRRAITGGLGLGLALLLPGAWLGWHGMPAGGALMARGMLAAWIPLVLVMAISEEVVLRMCLQPRLAEIMGPGPAIIGVALVFALMHLPMYGVIALPLDLGVGIIIGVLRQRTSSVAACATAHAVADIGYWFLP